MRYNYFVPSVFHGFVNKCDRILQNGESGIVLFLPKTDRIRRIAQLVQDYQKNIPLLQLTLIPNEIADMDDLLYLIESKIGKKKKGKIGICISNAEVLIEEKNFALLESILHMQLNQSNYQFLLFFEKDVTHPDTARHFSGTTVFGNVIYYPLYGHEDTLSFIDYSLNEWKFSINEALKEKIINQCGGQLWLVRQVIRVLRDEPEMPLKDIFETENFRFRLEQLTDALFPSEENVIRALLREQKIEGVREKHSYSYLQKMGLIENDEISIPLFANYIRKSMPKISMVVTEKEVFLNNINVASNFSKKEKRVVRIFLDNRGQLVSRDQIAKALWPIDTDEHYSDWAVDRIIARLRKKLEKLGMQKEVIKTIRNRGYMLMQ